MTLPSPFGASEGQQRIGGKTKKYGDGSIVDTRKATCIPKFKDTTPPQNLITVCSNYECASGPYNSGLSCSKDIMWGMI